MVFPVTGINADSSLDGRSTQTTVRKPGRGKVQ